MVLSAALSLCCQTPLEMSDSFERDKVLMPFCLCLNLQSCLSALRNMAHAGTFLTHTRNWEYLGVGDLEGKKWNKCTF